MHPKITPVAGLTLFAGSSFLAGLVLVACFIPLAHAETVPARAELGESKTVSPLQHVEIRNLQGDRLGRISDVAIDLVHGRVVEVFVVSGDVLGMGGKVVSVPPTALTTDDLNEVYFLNVTPAVFEAAPEIDPSKREEIGQNTRIAAAYRYFGREPYFTETGEPIVGADKLPRTLLAQSLPLKRLNGLDVRNREGETLGTFLSANLDIRKAEVVSIIVLAGDGTKTHSVIPARALRYSALNNRLVLDNTPAEFAAEPQIVTTPAGLGNPGKSQEEPYTGPRTAVALEQGTDALDTASTAKIKKEITAAKLTDSFIQVGTLNGRVTLRGSTKTEADKLRAGQIAVTASRLELVDNQIEVRPPAKSG